MDLKKKNQSTVRFGVRQRPPVPPVAPPWPNGHKSEGTYPHKKGASAPFDPQVLFEERGLPSNITHPGTSGQRDALMLIAFAISLIVSYRILPECITFGYPFAYAYVFAFMAKELHALLDCHLTI